MLSIQYPLALFFTFLCPAIASAQASLAAPPAKPLLRVAPDVRATAPPEATAIIDTLERYFKGPASRDAASMGAALHGDATVTGSVSQPSVAVTPYAELLGRDGQVRGKMAPPGMRGERLVAFLDVRDPLATARVSVTSLAPTRGAAMRQEHLFQLYKAGGRWQIISTVMHAGQDEGEPHEPTARRRTPSAVDADRAAVLAGVDEWWAGHDADDAERLDAVMVPGARSWFEEEGTLQYISYSKELERIRSGTRRPKTRPLPGEKRTVVSFTQPGSVAAVTMRVEIPRGGGTTSRSLTTFQLYRSDGRWRVVNLAGCAEK